MKIEFEIPAIPEFMEISENKWKRACAGQIRGLLNAWISSGTSLAHLSALEILEKQMPEADAKKLINDKMGYYFEEETP